MTLPRLVIVGGPPGAGKTTLAHSLGPVLQFPVVSRDEIKEGLVNGGSEGVPTWGAPIAQEAFALFYRVVAEYVRSECSVIAEAAFHTDFGYEPAELLRQADGCIVHCCIDRATARQRFIDRATTDPLRRQSHPDWEIVEAMDTGMFDWDKYEPMNLGIPILRVDTTVGYTPPFDELEVFSRGR